MSFCNTQIPAGYSTVDLNDLDHLGKSNSIANDIYYDYNTLKLFEVVKNSEDENGVAVGREVTGFERQMYLKRYQFDC